MAKKKNSGTAAISESLLRTLVHIFIMIAFGFMYSCIDGLNSATVDVVDCSKLASDERAACFPTLWDGNNEVKHREKNIFSQCYSGHNFLDEEAKYNFIDYIGKHVQPMIVGVLILLSLQVLNVVANYIMGARGEATLPSEIMSGSKMKTLMKVSVIVTAGLVGITIIMFFTAISTRDPCGFDNRNAAVFDGQRGTLNLPVTIKDKVALSAEKCIDLGDAMRKYQATYNAVTKKYSSDTSSRDEYVGQFGALLDQQYASKTTQVKYGADTNNDTLVTYNGNAVIASKNISAGDYINKRFWSHRKTKAGVAEEVRDISYQALGAYVLMCGQPTGDKFFRNAGQSFNTTIGPGSTVVRNGYKTNQQGDSPGGKIWTKTYRARTKLNRALKKASNGVRGASWFLSLSTLMLVYTMYAAGVQVKAAHFDFRRFGIFALAVVVGALFWISAGSWDVYKSTNGDNNRAVLNCPYDAGMINEAGNIRSTEIGDNGNEYTYVLTPTKENRSQSGTLICAFTPLAIALALAFYASTSTVFLAGKRVTKAKSEKAKSETDQYVKLEDAGKVVTGVFGVVLVYTLIRVFATLRYDLVNPCGMAAADQAARYSGGMTASIIGSVFLISFSYTYTHFGHHGLMMAKSFFYYHSGKATQVEATQQRPAIKGEEEAMVALTKETPV